MCKSKNKIFNFLVSFFIAFSVSILFFTGAISSILTLVYFTLILGILGIFSIVISVFCNKSTECEYIYKSNLVGNSIGAIISSSFALSINLELFSIASTFLIGIVGFFLVSILISLIEKIIYTSCYKYCDKEKVC